MSIPPTETIELPLPGGALRVHIAGAGQPVLFVHGILVNHLFWAQVIAGLAPHARCIAPDLPLGAHCLALPADAPRGPLAVAAQLAALIDALDLRDLTLVGNDTGGAICQLLLAHHPTDRIARVVLTNCDAFEQFFPPAFNWLASSARRGPGLVNFLGRALQRRVAQRLLLATVARTQPDAATLDAVFAPLRDPAVRHDLHRFLAAVEPALTIAAAPLLRRFPGDVDLLWASGDPLFRPSLARRLAAAFGAAEPTFIRGSRAFVPLDRPDALVALLRARVAAAA